MAAKKKLRSMSIADLTKKVRSAVEIVAKKHPEIVQPDTELMLFPKKGTMGFFLTDVAARRVGKGVPRAVAAQVTTASKVDGKPYARNARPQGPILVGFVMNEDLHLRL